MVKKSILVTIFSVCIFASAATYAEPEQVRDPLEKINRKIYTFNHHLDRIILKPTAKLYRAVVPSPGRKGVTNFFSNMGEVPTMLNDLLQGHVIYATKDLLRFGVNSTVGMLGLVDVASHMSLEKRYNDLGITLARWGITDAPYLMVPLFGPSTLRDAMALSVEYEYMTLWPRIRPVRLRNTLFVLDMINLRAQLLDSEEIMDQAALDPYVFIRDAYLQKRASLIRQARNEQAPDLLDAEALDDLDFDD